MTVIAAIKKNGKVCIGADSFWGNSWVQSPHNDSSKMIRINNFVVAIAGLGTIRDVCEEIAEDLHTVWKIENKSQARSFAMEVFKRLKARMEAGGLKEPKDSLEDAAFIIATPTNIYRVYNDMACFDVDTFCTSGAGWNQCLGSLNSLYNLVQEPKAILEMALISTCQLNPFCAEPIKVIEL